jgi:hypothetical protein
MAKMKELLVSRSQSYRPRQKLSEVAELRKVALRELAYDLEATTSVAIGCFNCINRTKLPRHVNGRCRRPYSISKVRM